MPRKRKKKNVCPSCGEFVKEPYKTWELVAPFPDKKMRITVTVMGMFKCASCGKTFRGTVSKLKLGSDDVEISSD
ncbi:MAG: chromatin protein Cren7 [Candidatus Bathyarchaeia archaeon]